MLSTLTVTVTCVQIDSLVVHNVMERGGQGDREGGREREREGGREGEREREGERGRERERGRGRGRERVKIEERSHT